MGDDNEAELTRQPTVAEPIPEAPARRTATGEEREQHRPGAPVAERELDRVAAGRGARDVGRRIARIAAAGSGCRDAWSTEAGCGCGEHVGVAGGSRAEAPEDLGVASEQAGDEHHEQHEEHGLARNQRRHQAPPPPGGCVASPFRQSPSWPQTALLTINVPLQFRPATVAGFWQITRRHTTSVLIVTSVLH